MEWSTGIARLCRSLEIVFITLFGIYNLAAALSIIEQPESIGVHEGETFILNCVVESTSQAYVVWYKEEAPGNNVALSSYKQIRREAPEAERLSIVGAGNTYNLRIQSAANADESDYRCVGYSRGSVVKSQVARVTVLPPGEGVSCQTYPQHVHSGALLNYICRAPPSLTSATLTWWRGDQPISTVQTLPDGALKLHYIVDDFDNYVPFTCTVGADINQANGLNCSIVPFQVPLEPNLNPHFNKVSVGGNAAFRCSAVASPPVNRIKWLVGYGSSSKVSRTGGRYEVKAEPRDLTASTLIIKNIRTADNGTTVRCVVMNAISQKEIATAYVIVSGYNTLPQTTPIPNITNRPVFRETTRSYRRTQRPRPTSVKVKTTPRQATTRRTRKAFTTKNTRLHKPRIKDVEISVHDGIPTTITLDHNDNGSQHTENSSPSKSSIVPATASVCVLIVLLIIFGGIMYFVVFRRKMLNKNKFASELRYSKKSYDANGGAVLTAEERAAARMSLRLQTIEVVVNQPPPEWQCKLDDVKPIENEYTQYASKSNDIPESPPPAYTKNPSPHQEKRRSRESGGDEKQNGVDNENKLNEEQENDAIYALPAKKPSTCSKRDNMNSHQNAKRQISDTKKHLLSQDYNDNNDDDFNDDIEWDQSSWDNSSFEDEEETVQRVKGHMYSGPGEKIYANTPMEPETGLSDEYGPTYGNLPNLNVDETDPTYSRVASFAE